MSKKLNLDACICNWNQQNKIIRKVLNFVVYIIILYYKNTNIPKKSKLWTFFNLSQHKHFVASILCATTISRETPWLFALCIWWQGILVAPFPTSLIAPTFYRYNTEIHNYVYYFSLRSKFRCQTITLQTKDIMAQRTEEDVHIIDNAEMIYDIW